MRTFFHVASSIQRNQNKHGKPNNNVFLIRNGAWREVRREKKFSQLPVPVIRKEKGKSRQIGLDDSLVFP